MGAIVKFIDAGTRSCELLIHPFVKIAYCPFIEEAAGDTSLIGNDKDKVAAIVELAYGLVCTFHPFAGARSMQITNVNVEHAVTIEKSCGFHEGRGANIMAGQSFSGRLRSTGGHPAAPLKSNRQICTSLSFKIRRDHFRINATLNYHIKMENWLATEKTTIPT